MSIKIKFTLHFNGPRGKFYHINSQKYNYFTIYYLIFWAQEKTDDYIIHVIDITKQNKAIKDLMRTADLDLIFTFSTSVLGNG